MKRTLNSSKSLKGCHRCKARKIKCDETKPSCEACQKAGEECPGFAPKYKWITKHERLSQHKRNANGSHARQRASVEQAQTTVTGSSNPNPAPEMASGTISAGSETTPLSTDNETVSFWYDQLELEPDFTSWLDYESMFMGNHDFTTNMPTSANNFFVQGVSSSNAGSDMRMRSRNNSSLLNYERYDDNGQSQHLGEVDHDTTLQPANGSTKDGGLLETFYRMSLPSKPIAQFTGDNLVEHYFAEVCPLYSCFDSELNPFRTLVSELWSTSSTIYYTIQSMAAANLANHYPCQLRRGFVIEVCRQSNDWFQI